MSFKKSYFLGTLILLSSIIQINCREDNFNILIETATRKPYYTALLVYTALWAKDNLDEYSKKHTSNLGFWIAYLIARGFAHEDATIWEPFLFMPGKGILVN